MFTTIQKWGNSQGIRLPKIFLDALGLQENDRIELIQSTDTITIRKAASAPHRTLEERLTEFYGKPIEQIERIQNDGEIDWGEAKGHEVW